MAPLALVALSAVVSACGEVRGPGDAERFAAALRPLNASGVKGQARFDREGEHLTVTIKAEGLSPDQIHQQAVHGFARGGRAARCPPAGTGSPRRPLSPERAEQAYGPRLRELAPFPTVGKNRRLDYRLTLTIDPGELSPLDTRVLVLTGLSMPRGSRTGARYEADLPVACGRLRPVNGGP